MVTLVVVVVVIEVGKVMAGMVLMVEYLLFLQGMFIGLIMTMIVVIIVVVMVVVVQYRYNVCGAVWSDRSGGDDSGGISVGER